MANARPWLTSNDLIESVKRKMAVPISQETFTEKDILSFANEEMMISQVPDVLSYHEDYFVYGVEVPLKSTVSRYPIPDRAIGMKMRDLFFKDSAGNLVEMTRMSADDKAYWQGSSLGIDTIHKFYIEGNDVVLAPEITTQAVGSLVFYIYLRPNQLVSNDRAAIIRNFAKEVTCTSVTNGDFFAIGDIRFVAGTDFAVGTDTQTATNLAAAIVANGEAFATSAGPVVDVQYYTIDSAITGSSSFTIQTTQGIDFDQVQTSYTDPVTGAVTALFTNGAEIDLLQTKPGHRTHKYDIRIPIGGIAGSRVNFKSADVPSTIIVGDYMCLANECIIPQVPPDLHNGLAERTCTRILASLGDQEGMQASMVKVQEIQKGQGTLLNQRVEGSPLKVTGRNGILRRNSYRRGF